MNPVTLILPGLYDSGPAHWQTAWERMDASCQRVVQHDWARPSCDDWVRTLSNAMTRTDGPVLLVGHSTGCLLVAFWAAQAALTAPSLLARVRGALLVAPSDPEGPHYPAGPRGFTPVPLAPLPFASIVVASTNDEYVTVECAQTFARAWGSRFVNIGAAGHINGDSGLGEWPEGRALLDELRTI